MYPTEAVLAAIGLGSNLDDPAAHVRRAFDEISELPETNTLIAETTTDNLVIYFWRLSSGEFQINVIQPNGKMYVLIFTVLDTGGGGYTSFEYTMA